MDLLPGGCMMAGMCKIVLGYIMLNENGINTDLGVATGCILPIGYYSVLLP